MINQKPILILFRKAFVCKLLDKMRKQIYSLNWNFFLIDTTDAREDNASNGSRIPNTTGYSKVTYVLTLTYYNNFITQESKCSSTDRAKINICYPWLFSISVYPHHTISQLKCTSTTCTTWKKDIYRFGSGNSVRVSDYEMPKLLSQALLISYPYRKPSGMLKYIYRTVSKELF